MFSIENQSMVKIKFENGIKLRSHSFHIKSKFDFYIPAGDVDVLKAIILFLMTEIEYFPFNFFIILV
jgi:hypothetical protein